jgi:DNA-binding IclR family transcriptional regulator
VLAALMPADELSQLLDEPGDASCHGPGADTARSLAEVERVRRQGYVVSLNERTPDTVSVAAPVPGAGGTTRPAVAVIGPADRMPHE